MFREPHIQSFPSASVRPEGALFSILIPSWNNLAYLKLCIHSINRNSLYTHQVIIHVNEGTDGSLEWVQQSGYAYTYSKENAGVCYAVNAAARLATTNYIVYLNDDMYVCRHWDQPLYKAIEQRADNLFYYSGTMIEFTDTGNKAVLAPYDFGRSLETFTPLEEARLNEFAVNYPGVDWFGSCWPPSVVHRNVWEKVGGYSIEFSPGFYSDPDFAMKLWRLGVRDFKGVGMSRVYHFSCRSTGRVTRNNGRLTFAVKWGFPASFFYKKVLRMGQRFDPAIQLRFPRGIGFYWARLRARFIAR